MLQGQLNNYNNREVILPVKVVPPSGVWSLCFYVAFIFLKSVRNLGTRTLHVLLFRISIFGQCVIQRQILKTGTEWEIRFQMDEHTFYRHLRITHSQFDSISYLLKQLGLNKEHAGGPSSIPLRQKLAPFCGIWVIRIVFVKCQTNLTFHNHQPPDVLLKCSQLFVT